MDIWNIYFHKICRYLDSSSKNMPNCKFQVNNLTCRISMTWTKLIRHWRCSGRAAGLCVECPVFKSCLEMKFLKSFHQKYHQCEFEAKLIVYFSLTIPRLGGGGGLIGPRQFVCLLSQKRLVRLCWNFLTFSKYSPGLFWDKKNFDQTLHKAVTSSFWHFWRKIIFQKNADNAKNIHE